MKRFFFIVVITSLCACSSGSDGTLKLTEEDSGRVLQIRQGTRFTISLASNLSTGYGWEIYDMDAHVLAQVGEPEYIRKSLLKGAGETTVLTFESLKAGDTRLVLVYRQPFEPDIPPEKTFSIELQVT